MLVTRPVHQAERLCALVEAHGGIPIRFPTLEIRDTADPAAAEALLRAADGCDVLLFASANAVERAARHLPRPLRAVLGAVGEGTARALRAHGLEPTVVPTTTADSEGLLALPALQAIRGKHVLLVRGEGGRTLLPDELRARGAEVSICEVYRRALPAADAAPLVAAWHDRVRIVIATSREILDNLVTLLGPAGRQPLLETPLVVVNERTAEHARGLGFQQVTVAAGPADEALVEAACAALGGGSRQVEGQPAPASFAYSKASE